MPTLELLPRGSAAPTQLASDHRDRTARPFAVVAAIISIASFLFFKHLGTTLAYKDALSHLIIARRVFDSPTPGFGQLGGVWLPLPHLLMLPLIWIDPLYYSGFAGSVISMGAYVVSSVLLYKIVHTLTGGNKAAGAFGALFFMLNPNVLYMQSTPMTELPLFACIAGMVFGLQRWIQTGRYSYLLAAAAAVALGTLTRYEAWVLLPALLGVVGLVAWRRGYTFRRAEGTVTAFVLLGGVGIAGWLVWNQLIFGNALNFQDGPYAKPSLWVGSADHAVGSWVIAGKTYWFAVVDNLGLIGVAVTLISLGFLLMRERLSLPSLPSLSLLVFFPFFVVALEKGQRPLHVTQISGELYNVRFGLLMVLPAAIFVGYLAGSLTNIRIARTALGLGTCVLFIASVLALSHSDSIATLREPRAFLADPNSRYSGEASGYLRANYRGGIILMESFGNETVLEGAHIALANNLYEGSYQLWSPDLADPVGSKVTWIVMRHAAGTSDIVYAKLHSSPVLRNYQMVLQNQDYYIFKARP